MASADRGHPRNPDPSEIKPKEKPLSHPDRQWEVRDAMHTILRAQEHLANPEMMKHVRKMADEHAKKIKDEAFRTETLAKRGRISEKAMRQMMGEDA